MIVWGGGGDGSGASNSGGKYDPATDSWSSTSQGDNCPLARGRHAAIWTGNEMIVWGGDGYPSVDNSGGRYDPISDTWRPTSTGANCPSARFGYSAVWTGFEMIVWGGMADYERLNDGGRYDPVTDTWTATSTGANCPSARDGHSAVWSGNEMIVWGKRHLRPPLVHEYRRTLFPRDGHMGSPLHRGWLSFAACRSFRHLDGQRDDHMGGVFPLWRIGHRGAL